MADGERGDEALSSAVSTRQGAEESIGFPSDERESGSSLLPSSDLLENINVPSESRANSVASASYTPLTIGNNYYAFLSFRGPDTRKGFVDHLHRELARMGLHYADFVFRDDKSLQIGEPLADTLLRAIKSSKVSIPVISENYATSEWCLREIIQIIDCVKSGEQTVYPVLYKVTASDVRHMRGKFGEAFKRLPQSVAEEVKQKGREALEDIVTLKVVESEKFASGHEGELVKALVEKIFRDRQHDFPPYHHPEDLVGIDDHVATIMRLPNTQTMKSANTASSETQIVVIYGIGGIGKTTLATAIYKKLADHSNKFECHSFLKDIRETIKSKGMKHVQFLHISNLTKSSHHSKQGSGIKTIQLICEKKKVLIVLDDVDRQDHLDNLIEDCNFKSGSWIIITCRDKALLKSDYKSYELKKMNTEGSLHLFMRYAFRGEPPSTTKLAALSHKIVATIDGLPLALVITGSFLKGKDESMWIETQQKLEKQPHMDVQQKLRISYDSLEYEEQQMFLDIACFFIGMDKRFATYLWEDLQYCVESGLQRMTELSLMKINDINELEMHDHIRDVGRAIACPTNKKPWKCSRLWDEKAIIVQRSKEENRNIEALLLDKNGSIKFMERESFRRMPYLKFLHMSDVDFARDFGDSLSELRWLEWEMCCDSFNAFNIYLEKLLVLDLSGGFISENWEGWSSIKIKRLKVLNLSRCLKLQSTPNLSTYKNLEMLILQGCDNLKEIDPSIGNVKHLVSLNLSHCTSLEKLPEQLGKLGELVELNLSGTGIKELPNSIGDLNKLKILEICHSQIERLPSSIGKLQNLQKLDADFCDKLEGQIFGDKCGLSSLETLRLFYTKISGLPEDLDQLSSLIYLDLSGCGELESLPKPPCSLSSLQLTCRSNELPSLSHLNHLQELYLWNCKSLQSIPELPSHIRTLNVRGSPKLERLPNLSNLKLLSELRLIGCDGLKQLDGLKDLKSLRMLDLSRDPFPSIAWDEKPYNPYQKKPDNLHAIEGLEKLRFLEVVNISRREHPQVLDLSKSEHLKELNVSFCESLVEIRCPSKFLKYFNRHGCESLKKFPDFWSNVCYDKNTPWTKFYGEANEVAKEVV